MALGAVPPELRVPLWQLLGYEDACRLAAAIAALQAEVLPDHVVVRGARDAETHGSTEQCNLAAL